MYANTLSIGHVLVPQEKGFIGIDATHNVTHYKDFL
jgi:hypothetical protein